MRTAEEMIKGKQSGSFGNDDWYYSRVNVIKLINEAIKEAIEECAVRAEIKCKTNKESESGYDYIVDGQSI